MASETNEIITHIKMIGAAEYSRAARYASQSVREIDSAQTRAERSARRFGERIDNLSTQIGRGLGRASVVVGTFGAGLVRQGLNFDAMIERSEIGIGSLIGSMDKAKDITADVRKFALQAPLFGTEQMIKTSQQLIGAGYDAKNVVPYLTTFSDTLSALGRKPEDLQRMTYAFVQMMSKGQISAEELRGQLGEIFPAQKILAREMGLSTQEFAKKMKEGTFKGSKYIHLLLRGMEKDFGGSTQLMATTFDGQLANIRESTKYTLGLLFKPLFTYLEKDMFPVLKYFGDEVVATMTDATLTSDQKFEKIKESADFWLMPIWDDFKNELGKIDWGHQVAVLSSKLSPLLGQAFAVIGKATAKALWDGFKGADVWGKSLMAAVIISKMGLWGPLFGAAGKALGSKMGKKVASQVATEMIGASTLSKLERAGWVSGDKWGKAFGKAARVAMVGAVVAGLAEIAKFTRDQIRQAEGKPKWSKESPRKKFEATQGIDTNPLGWETTKRAGESIWEWLRRRAKGKAQGRQHGGPVMAGSPYIVGERGPELFQPNMSGNIRPSLGGMNLHNYIVLDGRVAAQSVAKHNFNEMARR